MIGKSELTIPYPPMNSTDTYSKTQGEDFFRVE